MYAGVPTVTPVAVTNDPLCIVVVAFAIPKSAIFTRPSEVTIRFSGLRSRWTMPSSSAFVSPASTASSTPVIWTGVMRPMNGRSDPPSTYSIAMYGVPSCSKYSCTVTMLGWLSEPATRDSRTKRCANDGSAAWKVPSSFSATNRSRPI